MSKFVELSIFGLFILGTTGLVGYAMAAGMPVGQIAKNAWKSFFRRGHS